MLVKIYKFYENCLKLTIKGNNSLGGHLTILVMFDLFLGLTLLYIIAVYSLSLSKIIFKIITKNSKISLKLPIQGQQPNNGLLDSSENFRADRIGPDKQFYSCEICSTCFGFWDISQKLHFTPMFYF